MVQKGIRPAAPAAELERILADIDRLRSDLLSVQDRLAVSSAPEEVVVEQRGDAAVSLGDGSLGVAVRGMVLQRFESDLDGIRETATLIRRPDGRMIAVTERTGPAGRQTIIDSMPANDDLKAVGYEPSAEELEWLNAPAVGGEAV